MTEHLILSILYRLYIYICICKLSRKISFWTGIWLYRRHASRSWGTSMGSHGSSSKFNTACHHLAGTNTISPGSWMNLSAIFLLVFPKVWGEFHEAKRKPRKPIRIRYSIWGIFCFFFVGKIHPWIGWNSRTSRVYQQFPNFQKVSKQTQYQNENKKIQETFHVKSWRTFMFFNFSSKSI